MCSDFSGRPSCAFGSSPSYSCEVFLKGPCRLLEVEGIRHFYGEISRLIGPTGLTKGALVARRLWRIIAFASVRGTRTECRERHSHAGIQVEAPVGGR